MVNPTACKACQGSGNSPGGSGILRAACFRGGEIQRTTGPEDYKNALCILLLIFFKDKLFYTKNPLPEAGPHRLLPDKGNLVMGRLCLVFFGYFVFYDQPETFAMDV
ncbi:hypothetical protein CHU92_08430 [Flavobacterium cyanobacteriorum]|uniref:Uncharacterized protein n=1 Tax=Flavobacterium cyanobacteriorum TaxID=2022802 RepID=A0A255Z7B9_9FLAO|nr:hypothetical protein CHU92_08430 [Flavobacterium cyanobacteriorum]